MRLIVALDDAGGMLFNHRRQSQDAMLRARILEMTAGRILRMNAYSARQFGKDLPKAVCIEEDFLQNAGQEDFCFAENVPTAAFAERIQQVIVFRWNRAYPGDFFFDIPLEGWHMTESREFAGKSHEKITEEKYQK